MPKEKQPGDKGGALFRRRRFWARTSAMQMLYQLDMQKTWEPDSNLLENFDELLAMDGLLAEIDAELNPDDCNKAREYAWQLVAGVTEHHRELDDMIRPAALNWSLERISAVDRAILRLSAYEISKVGKVTPATAINEAVELAKRFGQAESPRFINGVLDNVRRAIVKKQLAADAAAGAGAGAGDGAGAKS